MDIPFGGIEALLGGSSGKRVNMLFLYLLMLLLARVSEVVGGGARGLYLQEKSWSEVALKKALL